jgi:putative ABC transport system ATP-binding protein
MAMAPSESSSTPSVVVEGVNHYFGVPPLRRQILFDVSVEIQRGEIIILTGPSGSGKTTLLTLIGGLRSTQEGSLRVLGREMRGATEETLVEVRKNIGYVFQAHNLLDSLTAQQNVQMSLLLHPGRSAREFRQRAVDTLTAVGLAERVDHYPDQLSGGQKQRVAIARALVSEPRLILADEPTASLDKQSGREVVDLLQRLAKDQGCTVLLVTHDNRILDIADRIVHLEDGRLSSFTAGVASSTQQLMGMFAQHNRKGELIRRIKDLPLAQFGSFLEEATGEFQQLLQVLEMSNDEAFESMIEQVIEAFTLKAGQLLAADRVTLFLVDTERRELWSKVAQSDGEKPLEIRLSIDQGVAGRVARTGETVNVEDAYTLPEFNRDVDQRTGYHTRSVLCVPIQDTRGRIFAVAQLLNKQGAPRFDAADERRFQELAGSIGVMLESWWRMSRQRGSGNGAAAGPSAP